MSAEDKKEKSTKYRIGWWLRWIKAAKKDAKPQWDDAESAYDEYESMGNRSGKETGTRGSSKRGYPIYAISSRILAASFFARKPKIKTKRLHGIDDDMALTMSFIVDRLGQYLVDKGDFLPAMLASVDDFIHASRGTPQVVYTTEMEDAQIPLTQVGEEYFEEGKKEPYDGEVFSDEQGFFYNGKKAKESTQKIYLAPAPYDEILHTPNVKTWNEITEMAFRFSMDKEEAEEKFNPDGTKQLTYKNIDDEQNKDEKEVLVEGPGQKLYGWECYCLETRKVYWICEDYKDGILLEVDDPYGLEGFFPVPPFAICGKQRKKMWGVPTFVYLESTINQLHDLYYRIRRLVSSIKRKALVDGLDKGLLNALNNLDGEEFLSVGNMTEILEKGGIANFIQYLPVQELVQALSEATTLEDHFKQNFYEYFRLPDVLRGTGDPAETLGAQEMQQNQALDSFKVDKHSLIELARNAAEMEVDLGLKVFSDEKIAKICGYEYLKPGDPGTPEVPEVPAVPEMPAQPPSAEYPQGLPAQAAKPAVPAVPASPPVPGHKERFFEALARLKNDEERICRIDFETESTSFRDDQRDLARQTLISQTVTQGLNQIVGIEDPAFRNLSMNLLLGVVEAMGASTQSEDMIKKVLADLEKAKSAPPAPPAPDYEQMKVDLMKTKADTENQKMALAAQAKDRELGIKEMTVNLKGQQQNIDAALTSADQQRQAMKDKFEADLKQFQALLDQALVSIEQQRVQIDAFQAKAGVQESLMEEARLAKEVSNEALAKVAEFITMQAPQAAPAAPAPAKGPDVHIHMPGAMRKKILRDEMGQMIGTEDEPIEGGM